MTPGSIGDLPGKNSTDGQIAVNNLEGQISGYQHLLDKNLNLSLAYNSLAGLYLQRGQYLGRLRDYDRAADAAARLFALGGDGKAFLARASVRQTFHAFSDALADLDEAEKRGAKKGLVLAMRASIWQAMGRTQEALALRSTMAAQDPEIMTLGTLGTVLSETGHDTEADAAFSKALPTYSDVSPFPIAWVDFQRGMMWEKAGQASKARTYYEYAVARLPQYAPAEGHLAGVEAAMGDRPKAIERLRKLTLASDDPEYVGQLSNLLAQTGQADEAKALLAKATAGFDDLIKRHPEGFADHAARFWLDVAKDPKKANELAKLNLKNRKSRDAYELLDERGAGGGRQRDGVQRGGRRDGDAEGCPEAAVSRGAGVRGVREAGEGSSAGRDAVAPRLPRAIPSLSRDEGLTRAVRCFAPRLRSGRGKRNCPPSRQYCAPSARTPRTKRGFPWQTALSSSRT